MDTERQLAPGLPRRLAAFVYDTLLVLPLIMVVVAIALGIASALGYHSTESPLSPWIVQLIVLLCCIGFFAAFWLKGGQTLGMQAWRVKLVAQPGKTLNLPRAALRCCAAAFSGACCGLGYLWCLVDPHGRYWHDYISGTSLVLVPKKPKAGARDSGAAQQ